MTTPRRNLLFHFTHLENLRTIVERGLCCDSAAQPSLLQVEVGNADIKQRRRVRPVPKAPGGFLSDYVPFYFAARSPMLLQIATGQVSTYQAGQADVVYLVTSVDRIVEAGIPFVFTDRNATLGYAAFETDPGRIDEYIDWDLMNATYWNDTLTAPDRKERRMAEFLVHRRVPWSLMIGLGVFDAERRMTSEDILTNVGEGTYVGVRRDWYY